MDPGSSSIGEGAGKDPSFPSSLILSSPWEQHTSSECDCLCSAPSIPGPAWLGASAAAQPHLSPQSPLLKAGVAQWLRTWSRQEAGCQGIIPGLGHESQVCMA